MKKTQDSFCHGEAEWVLLQPRRRPAPRAAPGPAAGQDGAVPCSAGVEPQQRLGRAGAEPRHVRRSSWAPAWLRLADARSLALLAAAGTGHGRATAGTRDWRVRAAVSARNLFTPPPLAAAAIRRCLCCSQQSRAAVKLCVMVLSRTENKLCQPSACPVMMLCLSTVFSEVAVYQARRKPASRSLLRLLLSPLPADGQPSLRRQRERGTTVSWCWAGSGARDGAGPGAGLGTALGREWGEGRRWAGSGARDGAGHPRCLCCVPAASQRCQGPVPSDCPSTQD